MQDWAEVHRLFHRERWSKTAIADKLAMSRNTVDRLLSLAEPPAYVRAKKRSALDDFEADIVSMLREHPKVPATVILERLRPLGYTGGITVLKERVARLRPVLQAATSYQRTSYLPGEVSQLDWWHTGVDVPVGKGAVREAFGLVATLPHSAAHATVFTFGRTTPEFCAAVLGCFHRLGGVPEKAVTDNEGCIVKPRRGGPARLVDDVAALFGKLVVRPVVLRPRFPQGKGQDERTVGYLETSFLPLRRFDSLADLQAQHDDWARSVAFERHHRRVGAKVKDAWRVERGFLRPLPDPLPDVDLRTEVRVMKDGFVRVADVDYSVPPGLSGRKVGIRASLDQVTVTLEGRAIATHRRSFVPADVVLAPAHARALRLAREARCHLEAGDVTVHAVNLALYDALVQS
ncbi:MAG TPA: IS21 family transposase [Acidimicrobiales bacterium]|nr:IS21 family transposase [Acidimicrobiales bacterium]